METINFFINGNPYHVNTSQCSPDARLVDFIRNEARLTGTKVVCREGGCGACVVSVKSPSSVTGDQSVKAVNSCLVPLLSCDGWNIATVEGLGNKRDGLHPIQKRMVDYNASQCGFCTAGMVMSMHSLMESKGDKLSSAEVEKMLDGNICRCTGYRPILDAFKSLTADASEEIKSRCSTDIEDSAKILRCTFNCGACNSKCSRAVFSETSNLEFANGEKWTTPSGIPQVFEILQKLQSTQTKYRLVAGNTGTGVYKNDGPYAVYVDLSNVQELKKWTIDATGITLGGGVTLSETIEILNSKKALEVVTFSAKIATHIERVANVAVRNRGTLAGNLMLKHAHKEFPSDIFVLMESAGARIRIGSADESPKLFTMFEFLNIDMYGKVILSIHIPQRKNGYVFNSFKITRRYQNAHAYVNAGFLFKLDRSSGIKVVEKPRIVFGGIARSFTHASATEAFFGPGTDLTSTKVLRDALAILDKEIQPDVRKVDGSIAYRKLLPKSLFYKFYLELLGDVVPNRLKSGAEKIPRLLSSGQPRYETQNKDNELYGTTKKVEGPQQTTGQAEYLNDIPKQNRELIAVFVLTTVAKAKIKSIDSREALRIPGVVEFVSATDVPAKNDALPSGFFPQTAVEPIFLEKEVGYAGQPIGLILAETREAAVAGMRKMRIEYEDIQKPLIDLEDAIKQAEDNGARDSLIMSTTNSIHQEGISKVEVRHQVKGQFKIGGQAHFHLETQGCLCIPMEDGMTIYCGTQWMDHTVNVVAGALGIPVNSINITVRRIGGSFGSRITRASCVVAAGAVAANKLNRPVRLILDLEQNLEMIGKRPPYLTNYDVGFDDTGRIGSLKAEIFQDLGCFGNEPEIAILPHHFQNVYRAQNWEVKIGGSVTNTPGNTFMRAPASVQAGAIIEYIMEHVAHALHKDPLEVRMANMIWPMDYRFPTNQPFTEDEILIYRLIDDLKKSSEYERRKNEVEKFNAENRWKKRGIALVPVRFPTAYYGTSYPVYVTISHFDGTVAVSHGGTEVGQGLNTKVAQTVAHEFKIPMDKVKIKPSDNLIGNNSLWTGGSITSESCCAGAVRACQILNERLDSIRSTLKNPDPTWEESVKALFEANQSLSAHYMFGPLDGKEGYDVWLANATEVEVDMLTGEYKIARVDLLEDTGKSISPAIDLGQIEGACIMGQGLWTSEQVLHDKETGQLLTNSTWTYKVPESKCIPEDFRVKLFSSGPNPKGILGTKGTGEPGIIASVCVLFALKNAIDSARKDAGNTDWYQIDGPVTPQDVLHYAQTTTEQFQI